MRYSVPCSYALQKRTFEGKTDNTKNDNALTSKYMPSYKYYMEIIYKDGIVSKNCHRTKQEALNSYEEAKQKAGKLM